MMELENVLYEVKEAALDVDDYYPTFSSAFDLETPGILSSEEIIISQDSGFPYPSDRDADVFFGEKNRAEILLTDPNNTDSSIKSNDKKYFNLAAYGTIKLLSSIMPNIYNGHPSSWAEAVGTKNSSNNYVAAFPKESFSGINLAGSEFNGSIDYVAYVGDAFGQITRVAGPIIRLIDPTPSITSINPNGFKESALGHSFLSSVAFLVNSAKWAGTWVVWERMPSRRGRGSSFLMGASSRVASP